MPKGKQAAGGQERATSGEPELRGRDDGGHSERERQPNVRADFLRDELMR